MLPAEKKKKRKDEPIRRHRGTSVCRGSPGSCLHDCNFELLASHMHRAFGDVCSVVCAMQGDGKCIGLYKPSRGCCHAEM